MLFVSIFCIKCIPFNSYSQKYIIAKSNEKQKKYVYIDTLKTYERVAEKGYRSIEIFKNIGVGYFLNNELGKAVKWYCKLFVTTNKLESEYYFRYSESLKSIGENEEANRIMEILHKKSKNIKEKI